MIRAYYKRRFAILAGAVMLSGLGAWFIGHIYNIIAVAETNRNSLVLIWLMSFIGIAWTNITAFFEKPYTVDDDQKALLDKLYVTVLVPAYNEDPALLRECIRSLLNQTRQPQRIVVVDDGSTKADYTDIFAWCERVSSANCRIDCITTSNNGKRHAQAVGIKATPETHVYLTVDSDTILDCAAIDEALKPFIDNRVQSVAGVLLPINHDQNFLTRFSGVWEIIWQLVDRSSQSVFGSVTVNSGPLAMYRAKTIRKYLDSYLNETFFGRPVKFSDDSLLTTYSITHGRTVQQPTAICFSATPDNVNHHIRRFVRWMRGSFIRSWWRFKYLPMNRYVYWFHWFKWMQVFLGIFTFWYIASEGGFTNPQLIPYLILVPVIVTYAQSLRYFAITRSDQSKKSMILNYLLSPVASLWTITVLRFVKWYAYATCLKTGWGTRAKVETRLESVS